MRFPAAPVALFGSLRLDVEAGEVVALIGRSGVGKTTLLRMIGGLERGFDGQVLVDGKPAELAPPAGFVFQDARLLPWLDAAANLRAIRPDLGAAEIALLLQKVGLDGQGAAFPRQMSGGMQRRLGLARAIAAGSGLLLLDEPFVSLDRAVVEDLQTLFRNIFSAEHPTVVVVSHDPADAARLADRVVLLEGRPAGITADFRLAPSDRGNPEGVARLVQAILDAQKEVV
jgi:ABC-type nitrate/sulfonate/bicarbonate transport system ATPase subunit